MKRHSLIGSLALILALLPACALSQTRRALLIACGEHKSSGLPQLLAPRNDVRLMASLLTRQYGFAPCNIAVIGLKQGELGAGYDYRERYATATAIRLALERLAQQTGPKDPVILYFSGHGTRLADARAATLNTEWLVTYDRAIPDWQIKAWIKRLRSGYVTAIFDTCYSGGFTTKHIGMAQTRRGLHYERVSKALPADVAIPLPLVPEPADDLPEAKAITTSGYTLLAACTEDQETQEIRRVQDNRCLWAISGFTLALYRSLTNPPAARSLDQLQTQVQARLRQEGCIQTPVFKPNTKRPNPFATLHKPGSQSRPRLPDVSLSPLSLPN